MWNGFIWLRTEISGGLFVNAMMNTPDFKKTGDFLTVLVAMVAKEILSSLWLFAYANDSRHYRLLSATELYCKQKCTHSVEWND
jgi:hypothetical protein